MIHVTHHAIQRYQERVANLAEAEVRAILSAPVFERAVAFRAKRVILAHGHRAVIEDGAVVTVLASRRRRHRARRIAVNTTWIDETPCLGGAA